MEEENENLSNKIDDINSQLVKANAFNENAALELDLIYNFLSENQNLFKHQTSGMPNLDKFFDDNGYIPVKVLNPCCCNHDDSKDESDDGRKRRRNRPGNEEEEPQRQRQGQRQGQAVPGEIFVPQPQQIPGAQPAPITKPSPIPAAPPITKPIPLGEPAPADQPVIPGTAPAPVPKPVIEPAQPAETPKPLDNPAPETPPITVPGPDSRPIFKPGPSEPLIPANNPEPLIPDAKPIFKPEPQTPANNPNPPEKEHPGELPAAASQGLVPEDWWKYQGAPGLAVGDNALPNEPISTMDMLNVLSYFVPYLGEAKGLKTIYDLYKLFRNMKSIGEFISPSGFQGQRSFGAASPTSYSMNENSKTDEITLKADEIKFISDIIRFKNTGIVQQQTSSPAVAQNASYSPPNQETAQNDKTTGGNVGGGNIGSSHESMLNGNQPVKGMSANMGLSGISEIGSSLSSMVSSIGKTLSDLSSKTFMAAKVAPTKTKSQKPVQSQPVMYNSETTGYPTAGTDSPYPAATVFEQTIFQNSGIFT